MQFEANLGLTDSEVKFIARGAGYTVFLTPTEAVLVLRPTEPSEGNHGPVLPGLDLRSPRQPEPKASPERDTTVVRLGLVGANPNPEVAGVEPLPGKVNYFRGNDPRKWRTGIPTYAKVRYRGVYAGVDVVYYGAQRQLEYDFVVAPGADPTRIRLAVTGAEALGVDGAGDLLLKTATGALRLHKPLIYQGMGSARREVDGGYVVIGKDRVGFRVAAYDAGKPLVIDPVLSYSTYLGGGLADIGYYGIAVDSAGNAYVTGSTVSSNFPTANPLQPTLNGSNDAFVAKLNATGSALVYATYLGGSDYDAGYGIAVDSAGNAYVTGITYSSNFPTANPLQPTLNGSNDAFVAKLNATGSALVYATYLGGSDVYSCDEYGCYAEGDFGKGIAVDSAGNAYVTGTTTSFDFPTANALRPWFSGYIRDAFVAKLNATGSALVYATYLGGSGDDTGQGIAVDSAGNAYVTGGTTSFDFPTAHPLQPRLGGFITNAFVAKIDAAGTELVYSTYLGGSQPCGYYLYGDLGFGIAVDSAGNAYVAGVASSLDFPTVNAFQPRLRGCRDAFVAKLNAVGSALVYSTYLGGSGDDASEGIAVDSAGNAYVTGSTRSSDFPLVNAMRLWSGSSDAFVAKLNATGTALVYSTYMGGSADDMGLGIAVDGAGNTYVTGFTDSSNFPSVNAFQSTTGGGRDAFVAKIGPATTQPPVASFTSACSELACSFDGASSSDPDGTIVSYSWSFGDGTSGSGPTVSHTYTAAGSYTATLLITDNSGATGTRSENVTVAAHAHVGDLDGASTNQRSTWTAIVTITVHNSNHLPVANATVNGSWSGGGGIGACATNGGGQCAVARSTISKSNASATFTVATITHATLTYASTGNHDPDSDSNGTTITVKRP